MAVQIQERYGSTNSIFDVNEKPKVSYSKFNYSAKNNLTLDIGPLVPLEWFETYPGDKIKLNCRWMLDTLPLVLPPMTNYQYDISYFWISKSALWKGWASFITKGASGVIDKKIPSITFASKIHCTPSDLACYLGVPICRNFPLSLKVPLYLPSNEDINPDYSKSEFVPPFSPSNLFRINVLPFLMYHKIWRDNYAPIDLLRDAKILYPDDLNDEYRLDYDASNFSGSWFSPVAPSSPVTYTSHTLPTASDTGLDLTSLRYVTFKDDYFTTAKPWLVRGLETSVRSSVDASDLTVANTFTGSGNTVLDFTPAIAAQNLPVSSFSQAPSTSSAVFSSLQGPDDDNLKDYIYGIAPTGDKSAWVTDSTSLRNALSRIKASTTINGSVSSSISGSASISLTANTLRNLLAVSVWQERNALAKGRYNALVKAHWGLSPRHPEYEPRYLGGTSGYIQFGKVLQTSDDSSGSPLGRPAGVGSGSGQSYIFNEHFNDYGYIMGVISIVPEVYYTQGLRRDFTNLSFDSQFQPEFARLGYEPILNGELYFQSKTSSGGDNDLFGYTTRSSWLKQRQNKVSGLLALPPDRDFYFSAYSQSRYFTSLPKLSAEFVSCIPQNIRRDFLAFPNFPAFVMQYASDVELIRALPYQSNPETFGF